MIKNILTSTVVSLLILTGFVNYYPLFSNDNLGATLTTLNSSDSLSDFPTTYNANNSALNAALATIEGTTTNSTITTLSGLTTANALTSATALAAVGTITTGTWSADTINVNKGGTGATSFDQYQIMFGSSTNALYTGIGLGSAGQLLTSGGAGTLPSWTTVTADESADYTWTGYHTFGNFEFTTASGTDLTIDNDLTVTGGIGTTTAGGASFSGLLSASGGIDGLNIQRYTNTGSLPTSDTGTVSVTATCGDGNVLGGGYSGVSVSDNNVVYTVYQNFPNATTSWNVAVECEVSAGSCSGGTLTVYAICADIR